MSKKGGTPGHKSIPWHQDTVILARLELVSTMMLQGAKGYQIAEALSTSLMTAYRDIERVRELRRRESVDNIVEDRNASIAQMRMIQANAWEQYRALKSIDPRTALSFMKEAREAEAQIIKLQGTEKPKQVDVTSGGKSLATRLEDLTDEELAQIAAGKR